MNKKIVFALALALTMGLTACGGSDDSAASSSGAASSGAASSVIENNGAASSEIIEQPAESTPVEDEEQPAESTPVEEEKPVESKPEQKPEQKPEAKPEQKPAPKPEQKPAESAPVSSMTANELFDKVWASLGEMPAMMDLDAETMTSVYGIDAGLLDGFVAKLPMMNVQASEIFVAKVKSGNVDTVKAALNARQSALIDQWASYLPEQLALCEDAKIMVQGDYVMFLVSYQAAAGAEAFNNAF